MSKRDDSSASDSPSDASPAPASAPSSPGVASPPPNQTALLREPFDPGSPSGTQPGSFRDGGERGTSGGFVILEAAQPASGPLMDLEPELLAEFMDEARDHLTKAEQALLAIESNPGDRGAIDTVFRAFHTIKGVAASLDMPAITRLAHVAESLLSRARDGKIQCTGGYAVLSFRSIDMLRTLCEQLTTAGEEPNRLQTDGALKELITLLAEPEKHGFSAAPKEASAEPAAERPAAAEGLSKQIDADKQADLFVRVRTDRLDRLLNAVGELVIAQSMVAQDDGLAGAQRSDLQKKVAQAGKIVRELQDLATSLRMVPLRATFKKLERTVRDVAQKTKKLVDLQTDGEDTELDRNLVDVLAEPLVHMIRNACDHGVEPPAERRAVGKPERGTVRLTAEHRGGHVVVELSDDGKGLDPKRIFAKAVERGIVAPDAVMSDSEIYSLIFAPGFSTAEQVTDVSGRGVGMDVVQRAINDLDGRITIRSELGKGTTFCIRLPLTLAITDGMLVRVGVERFVIPTLAITTTFRPTPDMLTRLFDRDEMMMFRGEAVPLFRLNRAFGIPGGVDEPERGLLMVIGDGHDACAMLVDELLGQQQVVVKALGAGLASVAGVSGGCILRDGRVGLILDPGGITRMARGGSAGDAFGAVGF